MVWRKLALVQNGQFIVDENASFEIPYLEEAKNVTVSNIKKYEHLGLVFIVKSYIQISHLSKNKYVELKEKIKNIHIQKYPNGELKKKIESSKLFTVVSNYKHKINEITHKIKEEEKDL
mgnify:CR=1 FL=1